MVLALSAARPVHAEEAGTEAWRDDARRLANEAADKFEEKD